MKVLINGEKISRSFGGQKVLKNVDIAFPKTGLFGILGASGSGKSTLLNIISGLDVGYQGECRIGGFLLKKMSEKKRNLFRLRHIGYVFQNFNLLELEDAGSNVLLPMDALSRAASRLKKRKVADLLSFVGLKGKAAQRVNSLSGGEKQRVCFARALANDPSILLCDEPSGALDEKNALLIFGLMQRVAQKRLVIVVSHDRKLVEKHCTGLVEIKDGVVSTLRMLNQNSEKEAPTSLQLFAPKAVPKVSSGYWFRHAFHLMKAKKIRTLVSQLAISLGLVGLGLSVYVSTSISGELEGAFDAIVEKNQIVMAPINPVSNPITSIYSAPEEEVAGLSLRYGTRLKDWGSSYFVNFEQFYQDKNELVITKGHKEIILPSFSIRSVNDYLWLDDYPNLQVFPSYPEVMEKDQVVLGLPYASMHNLCYGLQILRNYEALGNYISQFGLKVFFHLANYSWSYEDEQILNVVGVAASRYPTLYQLDHRWSTYLFEEKMRFPSSDHEDTSLPWIMNKAHYIEAKGDLTELLKVLRKDPKLESLIFQRPDHDYVASHCPADEICQLERAYVYIADKNTVPYSKIEEVSATCEEISGRVLTTSGSYFAFPAALMMGFAQKFFISADLASTDQVIDAYSDVPKTQVGLDLALPSGVYDGHYLKSSSGGFRFSSQIPALLEGRAPVGIDEVVLSKSLFEKLGQPQDIWAAGQISERYEEEMVIRDFSKATLKVVGVAEADKDVLYAQSDWTIDFFRDRLGMSSFLLEPTGAVFSLNDASAMPEVLAKLSKRFPDYRFIDPSAAVRESIATTTDYIGTILSCFSFIALAISSLLFIIVMMVSVSENKGEAKLLYVLGLSRSDIARSFIYESGLFCLLSGLIAALSLFFCQFAVHGYIAASFSSSSAFSMSWAPIGVTALFSFISFFVISLFLRLYLARLDFSS